MVDEADQAGNSVWNRSSSLTVYCRALKNTVVPNAPAFSGIRWVSSHISF